MDDFISEPGSQDNQYINHTHEEIDRLHNEYDSHVRPRLDKDHADGVYLPPPVIPEAHLLIGVKNKKILRMEIESLIRQHIIRQFALENPYYPGERIFMYEHEYEQQIKAQGNQLLTDFADKILKNYIKPYISKEELHSHGFTDENIREFVSKHVILISSKSGYKFSIPGGEPIIKSINSGRKELVKYVKLNPDARKTDVDRRTIDDSIYYATYHVNSLIGIGVFGVSAPKNREERIRLIYDPYSSKK